MAKSYYIVPHMGHRDHSDTATKMAARMGCSLILGILTPLTLEERIQSLANIIEETANASKQWNYGGGGTPTTVRKVDEEMVEVALLLRRAMTDLHREYPDRDINPLYEMIIAIIRKIPDQISYRPQCSDYNRTVKFMEETRKYLYGILVYLWIIGGDTCSRNCIVYLARAGEVDIVRESDPFMEKIVESMEYLKDVGNTDVLKLLLHKFIKKIEYQALIHLVDAIKRIKSTS